MEYIQHMEDVSDHEKTLICEKYVRANVDSNTTFLIAEENIPKRSVDIINVPILPPPSDEKENVPVNASNTQHSTQFAIENEYLIKNRMQSISALLKIRGEFIDLCLEKESTDQNLISHLMGKCTEVDQLEMELMHAQEKLRVLQNNLVEAEREINERNRIIRELRNNLRTNIIMWMVSCAMEEA